MAFDAAEAFFADIAALATRARQVVASAEAQALESMVKELEGVVSFMRSGCLAAFTVCFEERGWPNMETIEMRQDWVTTRSPGLESQIETLTQEIVQIYTLAYYTLRRSQADQVAAERAREESTAKLAIERAAWEAERAAWESERAALLDKQS